MALADELVIGQLLANADELLTQADNLLAEAGELLADELLATADEAPSSALADSPALAEWPRRRNISKTPPRVHGPKP